MLYELFSWMSDNEGPLPFPQVIVTSFHFESENKQALKWQRALLAEQRVAKIRGRHTVDEAKELQSIYQYDEFIKFMGFCQKEIRADEKRNSYFLLLNYFLSLESAPNHIAGITKLFLILLKEDSEQTIKFYQSNKRKFIPFKEINLVMWLLLTSAVEKTKDHLVQLTPQLSLEENPLTIVPLFSPFIADTEVIAAVILWLLTRVSVVQILQTNLLQKYMMYNLIYLGLEDSPVERLYYLLSQFPVTKALVEEAEKTQCEDRSSDTYAITGIRPSAVQWKEVEIVLSPPLLTPTHDNFNSLFQLFGLTFLQLAIEGYAAYEDERWHEILHGFLHRDIQQLPRVINLIATNSAPRLKALASIIDDEAVETLATQHNGAIFHLLPYKPELFIRLSKCDIEFYLRQVRSAEALPIEIVSQLMSLFITFCGVNKYAARLVYDHILDVVLEHRELLSDGGLLKILRKFSDKAQIIETRRQNLQEKFDVCVAQALQTGPLSVAGYHYLEDIWREVSAKLTALNTILSIVHRCPVNKCDFQVYLAKEYFYKQLGHFNLSDFFQALEIEQVSLGDRVNEYEQLLIAVLTAIDDAVLRKEITEKLLSDKAMSQRWMQKEYDGKTVANRAAIHDNVGLIKWLDSCSDLNDMSDQIISLAEKGRWHVVNYFSRTSQLSQKKLKELFVLAAEAGQVNLVQFLCLKVIDRMQDKIMVLAFIKAANADHIEVLQFLKGFSSKAINLTIIIKAFKMAAQLQCIRSIEYLGNLIESPIMQVAGESVLIHSVVHNRLSVIKQLCGLQINAPRLVAIEKAFLRAIICGNLMYARYFSNLPEYTLSQRTIDEGVKIAVANRSFHTLSFMFNLESSYPSRDAVEYALHKMVKAKCVDCVTLLCELTRNPPRQRVTEEALLAAIKLKSYPNVVFLSSLVSDNTLRKSFVWAAQYGSLDILKYCYKVHLPNQQIIQSALKKASGSEQDEMRVYLRSILPFAARSCLELFSRPAGACLPDNVKQLKRHSSTGDLERCGFFGYQRSQRPHSSSADAARHGRLKAEARSPR